MCVKKVLRPYHIDVDLNRDCVNLTRTFFITVTEIEEGGIIDLAKQGYVYMQTNNPFNNPFDASIELNKSFL